MDDSTTLIADSQVSEPNVSRDTIRQLPIEALCRKAKLDVVDRCKGKEGEIMMDDLVAAQKKVPAWMSKEVADDYDRVRGEDCIHKYNF